MACGRRFGKTTLGIDRILEPMLAGYPTAWFAPTYKYLSEVWRDLVRVLKPVIRHMDKTERRIELITGGSVECWTLEDEDAGRSRKYKRVVIDEAGRARTLEAAWTESIRPTLTDFKGDAYFFSTPKGRNFFWRAFTWGLDPLEPDWMSWSMGPSVGLPTTTNPYIDPAEVEDARRKVPERVFRQEYQAEFLEEAAGVFRGVSAAVDVGRSQPDPPRRGVIYTGGADLARVEDFTVISVLDANGRQCSFDRFNQISWERQIGAMKDACNRFNRADLVVDCTGVGDPIFERLRNEGLNVTPYRFSNASKNQLIDHLAMQIEGGKVRLMDVPEQTAELQAFEYELTPSRNVRMSAPSGMHDDCVIALALSVWGATNTRYIEVL